jgi:hypothetical protein
MVYFLQDWIVSPMLNLLKRTMTYPGFQPGTFEVAVSIPLHHLGRPRPIDWCNFCYFHRVRKLLSGKATIDVVRQDRAEFFFIFRPFADLLLSPSIILLTSPCVIGPRGSGVVVLLKWLSSSSTLCC